MDIMKEMLCRGFHTCENGTKVVTINGKEHKGEWVKGFYSPLNLPPFGNFGHFINEGGFKAVEIIFETVGRFVGKKDINNLDIFNGDIVRDDSGNIGVIDYSEHSLRWNIKFYKGKSYLVENYPNGVEIFDWIQPKSSIEIIGNIYENPDLIKDL